MSELGKQLAAEVIKFVEAKVPYEHRGTTMFGCDCTGMIIGGMKNLGHFKNYKLRQYPKDWNLHAGAGDNIREELSRFAIEIPKKEITVGDIPIFAFARCYAHAGVLISGKTFAHCYVAAGKCEYASLEKGQWASRWVSTYRFDEAKLNHG